LTEAAFKKKEENIHRGYHHLLLPGKGVSHIRVQEKKIDFISNRRHDHFSHPPLSHPICLSKIKE